MALLYNRNHRNKNHHNKNDSDSDGGPMLQQALPVNDNLEIDESQPAATAEEYLLRVRRQRQKLPKVSYATNINVKTKNKKQNKSKYYNDYNKYFETTSVKINVNEKLLPNNKWKQKFVQEFKMKRDVLINDIIKQSKWNKKHKNLNNTRYFQYRHLNIPNYMNSEQWLKFAFNYSKLSISAKLSISTQNISLH